MNKRIYFNDKFIELVDQQISEIPALQSHTNVEAQNSKKKLKLFIEEFLEPKNQKSLSTENFSLMDIIDFFKEKHYYIEAAGGLIKRDERYLFILRHNLWDLPKGKLEKGESFEQAAIRECEEECAVKNLFIDKAINSTFHIYPYKSSFALKQSYWFTMHTNYAEKLTPQIAEQITDVQWFNLDEIKKIVLPKTYYTIRDVIMHEILS